MKLNINYDALRQLGDDNAAKRKELFTAIGGALKFAPLLLEHLGPARALKFAANDPRIINADQKLAPPSIDEIKAFLTSERFGQKFLGGQKWAVPSDNPALTATAARVLEFFHENMQELDVGYLALYDFVDMRGSSETSFELISTSLGVTWIETKDGQQVLPKRNISEAKTDVTYLTKRAAFAILDDWFRFNKFYMIADVVNEFTATYMNTMANDHYGLFTALGAGIDIAFDTDAQTTFNNAAASIIRACEAKGYALGANVLFDIVVNPEKVGIVLAMLDAQRGSPMIAFGTAKQPIAFQVRNVIVTSKVPAASSGYYLVLPGRKLKRAVWLDPIIESKREPSVSAEEWYGKGQYNAIVGDSDQVRRVAFS